MKNKPLKVPSTKPRNFVFLSAKKRHAGKHKQEHDVRRKAMMRNKLFNDTYSVIRNECNAFISYHRFCLNEMSRHK